MSENDYLEFSSSQDEESLPSRLLIPSAYDERSSYPLVLFLHGSGERGSDNSSQLTNGTHIFCSETARHEFPCFVLVPQCPVGQQWVDMPWGDDLGVQPREPSKPLKHALALADKVRATYNIDSSREYVVGLSMGGFGTWDCITRFPMRFAAAIPVCGGGDEASITRDLASMALWAFHSSDDDVVKVHRSRNMVHALVNAGAQALYTEYQSEGHASWNRAFDEPNLLEWLFAQSSSGTSY